MLLSLNIELHWLLRTRLVFIYIYPYLLFPLERSRKELSRRDDLIDREELDRHRGHLIDGGGLINYLVVFFFLHRNFL